MFNIKKPLAEGDYVLMASKSSSHYLQIGEIMEIEYYPSSDDVLLYRIQFEDTISEYGYEVANSLKVLSFKE